MRALSRRAMVLLLGVSMTVPLGVLLARPAAAETLFAFDVVLNGAQENRR
jgi:hypothetical protein